MSLPCGNIPQENVIVNVAEEADNHKLKSRVKELPRRCQRQLLGVSLHFDPAGPNQAAPEAANNLQPVDLVDPPAAADFRQRRAKKSKGFTKWLIVGGFILLLCGACLWFNREHRWTQRLRRRLPEDEKERSTSGQSTETKKLQKHSTFAAEIPVSPPDNDDLKGPPVVWIREALSEADIALAIDERRPLAKSDRIRATYSGGKIVPGTEHTLRGHERRLKHFSQGHDIRTKERSDFYDIVYRVMDDSLKKFNKKLRFNADLSRQTLQEDVVFRFVEQTAFVKHAKVVDQGNGRSGIIWNAEGDDEVYYEAEDSFVTEIDLPKNHVGVDFEGDPEYCIKKGLASKIELIHKDKLKLDPVYAKENNLRWHHDQKCYYTMIIMLSSSKDYEGGVFQVRHNPGEATHFTEDLSIPISETILYDYKLEQGDCLIFPGSLGYKEGTPYHRPTNVVWGKRDVLVVFFEGPGYRNPFATQTNA